MVESLRRKQWLDDAKLGWVTAILTSGRKPGKFHA